MVGQRIDIMELQQLMQLKRKGLNNRKAFGQMFTHFQKPNDELLQICEINY